MENSESGMGRSNIAKQIRFQLLTIPYSQFPIPA